MHLRAQLVAAAAIGVFALGAIGFAWANRTPAPSVAVVTPAASTNAVDLYTEDELLLLQSLHANQPARIRLDGGAHVAILDGGDTRTASLDLGVKQGLQPFVFNRVRVLDGAAAGREGWLARVDMKPVAAR